MVNHAPSCSCLPGFTGNPSELCREIPESMLLLLSLFTCHIHILINIHVLEAIVPQNPCVPSPCGPYSNCREVSGNAVCSCQQNYIGMPPACRPECSVSSECSQDKACINLRCEDPCQGACGLDARCKVTNHNPICTCPEYYTGDPFTRCIPYKCKKKSVSLILSFL